MNMPSRKLKPIEIEDLLTYCYPSDLAYSPDGKAIAFTLTRPDADKNAYSRSVWVIRDGKSEQLTHSLDASFVLWKDNDTLIVRRTTADTEAGTTSLFALKLSGGEAQPWLDLPFVMSGLKMIDETSFAATGKIDANDPDAYKDNAETRKQKAEAKQKDADYQVVDEIPYWHNGAGFTNKERNALFLISLKNGVSVKRISAPFQSVSNVTVDGSDLWCTAETHTLKESRMVDVLHVDTKTGKKDVVYGKKDYAFRGLFVRNGELFGHASDMKEYGMNQTPDICRITKNHLEFVMDPHRTLMNHIAGDTMLGSGLQSKVQGSNLYTLATDVDRVNIWKYDADFNKTVLFDHPGAVYFLDVCGDKIAFAYEDAAAPTEIYEMNADGSDVKKLTDLNGKAVEGKYVALPHKLAFTSEGLDLEGWVLLPKDYNPKKKYPAVLDIHGGPRSIYGEIFFHEMQVWASKGYFVFFANIAGSDGRDDAFADIRGRYGEIDYKNVMDFTDAVIAAYPAIDTTKLCVTGGSYGGFMTNWIIGHTDRFCAAASQRSIASWISLTWIADIGPWFDPSECGVPEGDTIFHHYDKLWRASPLKYIEGAKTPTLFIHSDQDYRCPLPEGMQMMQALAYQNVETRMCIFHGENHELSRGGKPLHRIRRIKEITDWFEAHTGGRK